MNAYGAKVNAMAMTVERIAAVIQSFLMDHAVVGAAGAVIILLAGATCRCLGKLGILKQEGAVR